jgi:hypothetical protein
MGLIGSSGLKAGSVATAAKRRWWTDVRFRDSGSFTRSSLVPAFQSMAFMWC